MKHKFILLLLSAMIMAGFPRFGNSRNVETFEDMLSL